MNDDEYWEDLGKRAAAWGGWRWMPGMLDSRGGRVTMAEDDGSYWTDDDERIMPGERTPVLHDPATMGCLVYQVETRVGFPVAVYVPRVARLLGNDFMLAESAHDNGATLATSDLKPTRAEVLVSLLEEYESGRLALGVPK